MEKITVNEFDDVIKNGTTLVDFFADWCGPCKMLGPVLEELDSEYPDIRFVKVNIDENMELAERYQIMSIPTVYIFKDGEVFNKMNGYRDVESVKEFINSAV